MKVEIILTLILSLRISAANPIRRIRSSRSDIPIEEEGLDNQGELDLEIQKDIGNFHEIKQNIHDLKLLLNQKNNVNEMSPTRKSSDVETSPDVDMKTLELEMEMVKEEGEIEVMEKDLEEIEEIIQTLGTNLTAKTSKDVTEMLDSASKLLTKLEKRLKEWKDFESRKLTNSLSDVMDKDLPDFLQVPTEEEFNRFTFPYYFDRDLDKHQHQHGRNYFGEPEKKLVRKVGAEMEMKPIKKWKKKKVGANHKKTKIENAQAYEDEKDDPLVIAIISLAIVIVAGILAAILSVYCCKRCQYEKAGTSSRGSPRVAYTSDDFEKEEDVYLEDFGEGDFFEWPRPPVRIPEQQQQHHVRQKQVIVEFSRNYSGGYCKLTTGSKTTEL